MLCVEYVRLPRALLFEVSRASPLGKCHRSVLFREEFAAGDRQGQHAYRLSGVVYHKGLGEEGHYTCKVRGRDGEFYYVDDQHVEEAGLEGRSASATLLLYHRLD